MTILRITFIKYSTIHKVIFPDICRGGSEMSIYGTGILYDNIIMGPVHIVCSRKPITSKIVSISDIGFFFPRTAVEKGQKCPYMVLALNITILLFYIHCLFSKIRNGTPTIYTCILCLYMTIPYIYIYL